MSRNIRFFLSYDIKVTLKLHLWRENAKILSYNMGHIYGHHCKTVIKR